MARIDAAIAERARQQLGLITYAQLTDLGCTPRMWQVRLARGELHRAGTRVLQVASTPVSWEQRVLAAQLDAGEGAVVSHLSAAALWGFHGIGRGAVEVTVPACRQVRPTSGVVHRSRRLERVDIGHQGPFTLTQPADVVVPG